MKIIPMLSALFGLSLLLGACTVYSHGDAVRAVEDPATPQLTRDLDPIEGPAPGAVASQPVLKAGGNLGALR